ncbi:response regulator [Mariprofundus erugo]|uniref:histidine kinase n=1 Tax=Mariprofundus erugo TaxID=2528639 RepID=A0A5R9GS94_9PROT|nr:response regulator [Mariprofundus erugo]TLS67283.1 response regulator [Mariprofundus erugo]
MKLRMPDFDSDHAATISRALVENALRMRSMAFLSQVKMSLMLDTLKSDGGSLSYMRKIKNSVSGNFDDWVTLPVKISEEARELQQITLTMERRREELRSFLAEQTQALRKSESRFRQLFDLIPDGVGVYRHGCWRYLNPAAVAMFGASDERRLIDTAVIDRLCPENAALLAGQMEMSKGVFEERLLRLDGSEFWGELRSCQFDDQGTPSVLLVMRDITRRKQSAERIHLLHAAIMQSDESVMILDAAGVVELANPAAARLFDCTPEQLAGRMAAALCGGESGKALCDRIDECVQNGQSWNGELTLGEGEDARMIARRVSPVLDAHGRVCHQIVVDRDITEERRRLDRMEHVQRLESLGVLAGGIAHDFNNLLTVIMGHTAVARTGASDNVVLESLQVIEATGQRAAELCNQMLAYSGKGQFVVRPLDLSELVLDMVRLLEISIAKNVQLRYELATALPAVEVDLSQIRQVIMNLVINASESMDGGNGEVVVATGEATLDGKALQEMDGGDDTALPGRYIWLEVRDNGCGMDAVTRQRLFEPFFTTKFTGRGLGMSATLGIVRGHRGVIRISSLPGQGTTFRVWLPAAAASAEKLAAQAEEVGLRPELHGRSILVVDDEEAIRSVAALMLEHAGFRVWQAADGMEAIAQLEAHRDDIDCVLLDMTMPRMGGEEAFGEMRRIRPDIRVVLCSGYDQETATLHFTGKGLAGFLQKPFTPAQLIARLHEIMGDG